MSVRHNNIFELREHLIQLHLHTQLKANVRDNHAANLLLSNRYVQRVGVNGFDCIKSKVYSGLMKQNHYTTNRSRTGDAG